MIDHKIINTPPRLDCVIIWGHGAKHVDNILDEIRKNQYFEIINLVKKSGVNIKKLVNQIYSYDYAPLYHLKSKISYLKSTPPEVFFIFIKNLNPREDYFGEKKFRHKESVIVRDFKAKLREKFNPKDSYNKQSKEHIVHATDNETQTDLILKILDYKNGIMDLNNPKKILSSPYYIDEPSNFSIQLISLDQIYCSNAIKENNKIFNKKILIKDSVQYKSLENDKLYENYIHQFRGKFLKQDYKLEKFKKIRKDFNYLGDEYSNKFIIAQKTLEGSYIIIDGLHRASILLYNGEKHIKACVYDR